MRKVDVASIKKVGSQPVASHGDAVARLEKDGYLYVPQILSGALLNDLRAHVKQYADVTHSYSIEFRLDSDEPVFHDGQNHKFAVSPALVKAMQKLMTHSQLLEFARLALGPNAELDRFEAYLRIKNQRGQTPMHTDMHFFQNNRVPEEQHVCATSKYADANCAEEACLQKPWPYLTLWSALEPCTPATGALLFMPESCALPAPTTFNGPQEGVPLSFEWSKWKADEYELQSADFMPGEVFAFKPTLLHASGEWPAAANPRFSVDFRAYNGRYKQKHKPVADEQPSTRPPRRAAATAAAARTAAAAAVEDAMEIDEESEELTASAPREVAATDATRSPHGAVAGGAASASAAAASPSLGLLLGAVASNIDVKAYLKTWKMEKLVGSLYLLDLFVKTDRLETAVPLPAIASIDTLITGGKKLIEEEFSKNPAGFGYYQRLLRYRMGMGQRIVVTSVDKQACVHDTAEEPRLVSCVLSEFVTSPGSSSQPLSVAGACEKLAARVCWLALEDESTAHARCTALCEQLDPLFAVFDSQESVEARLLSRSGTSHARLALTIALLYLASHCIYAQTRYGERRPQQLVGIENVARLYVLLAPKLQEWRHLELLAEGTSMINWCLALRAAPYAQSSGGAGRRASAAGLVAVHCLEGARRSMLATLAESDGADLCWRPGKRGGGQEIDPLHLVATLLLALDMGEEKD